MPELPEVEIAARQILAALGGRGPVRWVVPEPTRDAVLNDLAASSPSALLRVRRHGKQLALDFDDGCTFQLHLGMTGRVESVTPGSKAPRHARFLWLTNGGECLAFVDTRRFARFGRRRTDAGPASADFAGLGPDALSATLADWIEALARSRPVKPALLDQANLAGIGNIYACEGLFLASIDPRCLARSLFPDRVAALRDGIRSSMETTLRRDGDGPMRYLNEGGVENPFGVYGRSGLPCPRCAHSIERFSQAGRSTWWCPSCQRGAPSDPG